MLVEVKLLVAVEPLGETAPNFEAQLVEFAGRQVKLAVEHLIEVGTEEDFSLYNVDTISATAYTPTPPARQESRLRARLDEQNALYALCPCGSGKKLKFCCYPKRGGAPYTVYSPWHPPFRYIQEGQHITDAKDHRFLDLRGWGYLTGHGDEALRLDPQQAECIQDEMGRHVVELLNADAQGAVRKPRTDHEIVVQTAELAREILRRDGFVAADDHAWGDEDPNPRCRQAWLTAQLAQLLLTDTDPRDAMDNLLPPLHDQDT